MITTCSVSPLGPAIAWCRILAVILSFAGFTSAPRALEGVVTTPAQLSRLATVSPLNAVVWTGQRGVAVGPRGHILVSEGDTWRQIATPTSSDLTAVHFVSERVGWAVGHNATVLNTRDGGLTWELQLDGRRAAQLMVDKYRRAATAGEASGAAALAEAERFAQEGPGRPFLGVWFRDELTGFVVGAFNLVFRTDDGGKTWVSWFDSLENPNLLNLYAIIGDSRSVYIAGEQGLLLKLSDDQRRFKALPSDYAGSFFGAVIPKPGALLLYGMRGNVRFTQDDGAHWEKIDSTEQAGITAGVPLGDGRAVLASQSGRVLLYEPQRSHLLPLTVDRPMPYAGIASVNGRILLAGFNGVRTETLKKPFAGQTKP